MQYFLFHPVLNSELSENKELFRKFMCLGDSFASALELGAVKLKQAELDEDDSDLNLTVMSVEVTSICRKYNPIVEKIVQRFGWDLTAKRPCDEASASMIACLLKNDRFDVLEHLALASPVSVAELPYSYRHLTAVN